MDVQYQAQAKQIIDAFLKAQKEAQAKQSATNSFINHSQNLAEGTYKWNGKEWEDESKHQFHTEKEYWEL